MLELKQHITLKNGTEGIVSAYRVVGCEVKYHIKTDKGEVLVSESEIEE
jgi:hypothetical protein